ncbi:MAG: T9SS type A sorting domain-containing protein [Bacteroidetes bacterium]|nr:T9SS type A sorting domain-containing protein [Bacteroidota bacterium]
MKKSLLVWMVMLLLPFWGSTQVNLVNLPMQPNGSILTQKIVGNTLYMGGNFTGFELPSNYWAAVNLSSGQPVQANLPAVNSQIRTLVSDGSGGYLLGGYFTTVGGQTRTYFARLNSSLSVHPLNLNVNGAVNKIVVNGNIAYVFGSFTSVNYQTRVGGFAINLSTNTMTSWSPGFTSADVQSALIYGNYLVVAGRFTHNGTTKQLVCYNVNNGSWVSQFNPLIRLSNSVNNAIVYDLAVSGTVLYFGGNFNSVNSNVRTYFAGIDLNTSMFMLSPANVNLNSSVFTLAVNGQNIFVGGGFTSVNNISRARLFAFNTNFLQVLNTWSPNPNSTIEASGIINGSLWVSGAFTSISGNSRDRFAIYNLPTNQTSAPILNAFNPRPNATVRVFANFTNGNVIATGGFTKIGLIERRGAAAMDLTTFQLLPFNPNVNGSVYAIESSGNNVFLGGNFNQVGGNSAINFAVVNNFTGTFNPVVRANTNNSVRSICFAGSRLFVGGDFSSVTVINSSGSASNALRNGFFVLDNIQSSPVSLSGINPTMMAVNGSSPVRVNVIRYFGGSSVYVGGRFSGLRNSLLSLNPFSGSINSFNAGLPFNSTNPTEIFDIVQPPSTSTIAFSGKFNGYLNNSGANYALNLARVDAVTGTFISGNTNGSVSPNSNLVAVDNNQLEFHQNYQVVRYNMTNSALTSLFTAYSNNNYPLGLTKLGVTTFIHGSSLPINGFNVVSFGSVPMVVVNSSNLYLAAVNVLLPTAPTIPASGVTVTDRTVNSFRINWNNGNGTSRLVYIRPLSAPTAFPQNGLNYYANNYFGNGSNIGGGFVVMVGQGNTVVVNNLSSNTTYSIRIVEFNGGTANPTYANTIATNAIGSTLDFLPPTSPAFNLQASGITQNSLNLSWSSGNGMARIVIAKAGAPVDISAYPTSNSFYWASSDYGFGSDMGNGNYVVYDGSGNNCQVTNLDPGQTYHFAIFEYNSYGGVFTRYLTSSVPTISRTTLSMATRPTQFAYNVTATSLPGGAVNVSWTPGNGTNRMVLALAGAGFNPVFALPSNGVSYTANADMNSSNPFPGMVPVIKNGAVQNYKTVYNGTANSCVVSGLMPNTTYHFVVVEYNTNGPGTQNYYGYDYINGIWVGPGNVQFTTPPLVQTPTVNASNVQVVSARTEQMVRWTNGNGAFRIVVARKGGPVNTLPVDNQIYIPNANFQSAQNIGGDNKIVYAGFASSVLVSGLEPYTDYFYSVLEYNSALNVYTSQTETKYLRDGVSGNGKTLPPNWPRYSGSSGKDAAGGVALDASSNVYVAGTYAGSMYMDLNLVNSSSNDIFLAKYSQSGNLLWNLTAGGSGEDAASTVALDASGNAYIVGSFRNVATFGSFSRSSNGSDDAFIAKVSSSGSILWVQSFGGSNQDVAFAVAVDPSGNPVVTGYFHGTATFSNSQTTLTSNGATDVWVAKFASSNGALTWAISAGGTSYDYGQGIATDASGSVIVVGDYKLNASFGSTTLTNSGNESNGFIAKLTSGGAFSWAKSFGGPGSDGGFGVGTDVSGNIYLAGLFSNVATFGSFSKTSLGVSDAFVARLDSVTGSFQWVNAVGGIGQDGFRGLSMDPTGKVFVVGSFAGTVAFGSESLVSSGNLDVVVAGYESNGAPISAKKFGGNLDEEGRGIFAKSASEIFFTGYFNGIADFSGFEIYSRMNSQNQPEWDWFVHNASLQNSTGNTNADLVLWYKFNGDYNDYSGYGFHASQVGTSFFGSDRFSQSARSLVATGTSGADVTIGTTILGGAALDEISYMSWVNIPAFNNSDYWHCITFGDLSKVNSPALGLWVGRNGEVVAYVYSYGNWNLVGQYWSANNIVKPNTWTHISVVYKSGNNIRLFVDGAEIGSASNSGGQVGLSQAALTLGFSRQSSPMQALNGNMDDFRIYKKALTQNEILAIMAEPSTSSRPDMVANSNAKKFDMEAIDLMPNPNQGIFNVRMQTEASSSIEFKLSDLSGKLVHSQKAEAKGGLEDFLINSGSIEQGYYILEVIKNDVKIEAIKVAITK